MSPLVTLTFGVALLPFSWPFLGALPALILFALLLSHGGAASWWWRTLPPLRSAGWLVADFLALSLAAVVISSLPPAWSVPVSGLTGIVNARAWSASPRPSRCPARSDGSRFWCAGSRLRRPLPC